MAKLSTVRNISLAALSVFQISAHAGILDFTKTKTESSDTLIVYDLPGFSGSQADLKNRVREALTYQGDNAFVQDNIQSGEIPRYPNKLTLKPLSANLPVNISIPSCAGATFTVSSQDSSLAQYGDSARYMACGFPYVGGYRVNFYASFTTQSGGVTGLFNGKTLGSLVTDAVGMSSNPQKFINSSITKMEELFKSNGWTYNIVEMTPAIEGKTAIADSLANQQVVETKRAANREKRLAARVELNKLAVDASDRSRLIKAVQANDEDLVALFVEAGAVDLQAKDANGKAVADYAANQNVRNILYSSR